jgi:hypothetical protein
MQFSQGVKFLPRWLAAITVLAVIVLLSVLPSTTQEASRTGGSGAISRLFGSLQDYLLTRNAPVRNGFRWIEVEDPRSRKGDKLRSAKP